MGVSLYCLIHPPPPPPALCFLVSAGKKKKKTRGDHFKLRFRKNFQALLEEQVGGGGDLGGSPGVLEVLGDS